MTDPKKRTSIQPTYDSAKTGPAYHVTSRVGDCTVTFERPIGDPFVTHRVTVGWPDLLRGLLRRRLDVTVIVGGDRDRVEDVLELDAEWLGHRSTRRDEWDAGIRRALAGVAVDEELAEMTGGGDD
jgi:hypothetical protein